MVPFIYVLTVWVNVLVVLLQIIEGFFPETPNEVKYPSAVFGGLAAGLLVGFIIGYFVVPYQRQRIDDSLMQVENEFSENPEGQDEDRFSELEPINARNMPSYSNPPRKPDQAPFNEKIRVVKTEMLFAFLQTLTATFSAFVHGSNDVR